MKKGRGKGTPHPRKIRALRDLTNQRLDEDQETRFWAVEKGKAKAKAKESSASPWVRLNAVHKRVSETLNKIDGLMVSAHRLGLGGELKDHEVESFAAAMTEVESILVNWDSFLRSASTRSGTPPPPPESPSLLPGKGLTVKDVIPMEPEPDSETMVLSSSPLVPSSYISSPMFFTPLPPRRSKPLAPTPHPSVRQVTEDLVSEDLLMSAVPAVALTPHSVDMSQESTGSVDLSQDSTGSSFSSQMVTPVLPAPPAFVHLFRSTVGCSGDATLSTPSRSSRISSSAESMSPGMMTPLPPPDLLRRYPSLGHSGQAPLPKCSPSSETPTAATPRFTRFSPILITPAASRKTFIEPFRLRPPVLPDGDPRLRRDGKQSLEDDESPGEPDIVDDLTASTVKRLGEKGLEDELWLRLELGSAAAHTFVRKRPAQEDSGQQAPPWHGSGRKNLNEDMDSEVLLANRGNMQQ